MIEETNIPFTNNTFKLIQIQYFRSYFKWIWSFCKTVSGNLLLSPTWNIEFQNLALQTWRLPSSYITLLQKTKNAKNHKTNFLLFFKWLIQNNNECRITYWITRRYSLKTTFLQNFLYRFELTSIKILPLGNNKNYLFEEYHTYWKKVR